MASAQSEEICNPEEMDMAVSRLFTFKEQLVKQSMALAKEGQYTDAVQCFQRLAQLEPQDVTWQLMLASCFRRSSDYQSAFETYRNIISVNSENLECLRYLVQIGKEQGFAEEELHDWPAKLKTLEGRSTCDDEKYQILISKDLEMTDFIQKSRQLIQQELAALKQIAGGSDSRVTELEQQASALEEKISKLAPAYDSTKIHMDDKKFRTYAVNLREKSSVYKQIKDLVSEVKSLRHAPAELATIGDSASFADGSPNNESPTLKEAIEKRRADVEKIDFLAVKIDAETIQLCAKLDKFIVELADDLEAAPQIQSYQKLQESMLVKPTPQEPQQTSASKQERGEASTTRSDDVTFTSLETLSEQIRKINNQLEDLKDNFTKQIHKISKQLEDQSLANSSPSEAVNKMAEMVADINRELKEKKNILAPKIKHLRAVRSVYNNLEAKVLAKRNTDVDDDTTKGAGVKE